MRVLPVAVIGALLASARIASADQAGELIKRGVEQYKSGKYAEAAVTLQKAYALDHKPETLFALAQAERLDGHCDRAVEHYREIVAKVSDLDVAKLVEQALLLCPAEAAASAPAPAVVVAPAPVIVQEPRVVTRTVVEQVHHTDKLAVTAIAVGAMALGGSFGLLVASNANRDAAHGAFTFADYDHYQHRADVERTAALVGGTVGLALVGVAAWRLLRSDDSAGDRAGSDVVVAPISGGAAVAVLGRF